MLIQFKCRNYRSIKEEITFSMLSTNYEMNELSSFGKLGEIRVHPVSLIYGMNGTGKTNLIDAMCYINKLVTANPYLLFQTISPYQPHKLNGSNIPTVFELQFLYKGIQYVYGLSLTAQGIEEEYLYYFINGKQEKVFDRIGDDYTYGQDFEDELSEIVQNKMKSNRLFLTVASWWSTSEFLLNAFEYLQNKLIPYQWKTIETWFDYTIKTFDEGEAYKEELIHFFNGLGINIIDIELDNQENLLLNDDIPSLLSKELKNFLNQRKIKPSDIILKYTDMRVTLAEESKGINKLFALGGIMLDVLARGDVLVVDELDAHLQPEIVDKLIHLFASPVFNKHGAQLIFTTPNTRMLESNLLSREQIYFIEKREQHTDTSCQIA